MGRANGVTRDEIVEIVIQLAFYTGHSLRQIIAGKFASTASTHQRTLSGERGKVLLGQFVPFGGAVLTGQQQALRHRLGAGILAGGRLREHKRVRLRRVREQCG